MTDQVTWMQINRTENGGFQLMIDCDDEGECVTDIDNFATLHDLIDSAKFNTAIVNAEIGVVQDAVNQAMDIYKADCAKAMIYLTEIVKEVS